MRSRRVSPVLVWLAIATVCVAVIGGSFAYASAVGDPLVREEAARRPPPTVTFPNGSIGIPGSGSGSGSSGALGGFSLQAFGIDPATALPPSACLAPLARVAAEATPTVETAMTAWTSASDCAITQGSTPIDLDRIVGDPTLQPCVATFLTRETLRYRSPATVTRPLDLLVQTCLMSVALPGSTSRSSAPSVTVAPGVVTVPPTGAIPPAVPDDVAPLPPGDSLPAPTATTVAPSGAGPTTTPSPAAVP